MSKKTVEPDTLPYSPVTLSTPVMCAGCERTRHTGMVRDCDNRFLCWVCYDLLLDANAEADERRRAALAKERRRKRALKPLPAPSATPIVPYEGPHLLLPNGDIILPRRLLEAWAGRPLSDSDLLAVVNAVPHSAIPAIVAGIVS